MPNVRPTRAAGIELRGSASPSGRRRISLETGLRLRVVETAQIRTSRVRMRLEMKGILSISFVLSLVLSISPALAADSAAGKKLYDTNCSKCHDSSIHTRPDHKIKSLDALDKQLMGCSKGAHVELSDGDRANVEQYLNEQFYKFK